MQLMEKPGQVQHLLPEKEAGLLYENAVNLLRTLIAHPSFSGSENETAEIISQVFDSHNIPYKRLHNNVWVKNLYYDPLRPSVLLNSHHDTVKPSQDYSFNPFQPLVDDGKLYGLGSNDAGGALVSLLAAFLFFYDKPLRCNLIFCASAEEEISGTKGISSVLNELEKIDFAIVGEPTSMRMAIAEKGLIVADCMVNGTASHAAHPNHDNAIYNAMEVIEKIKNFQFSKSSPLLGDVKMTVTSIRSGQQHNIVPAECRFTVDVRTNELYTNKEIVSHLRKSLSCHVYPRSLRLNSSSIDSDHPVVQAGIKAGCTTYGSPTISDQALMPFPSVKIGPGDSLRSHTANEFIYLEEIKNGIEIYSKILSQLL